MDAWTLILTLAIGGLAGGAVVGIVTYVALSSVVADAIARAMRW